MKSIKYLCYYDDDKYYEKRLSSPAAINKINYIMEKLTQKDYLVEIITPSYTLDLNKKYNGKLYNIKKDVKITNFFTKNSKNKVINYIYKKITYLLFSFYLIKNTHKNEEIIIYHSISFYHIIKILKIIKKIKIILEVEEIYQNVGLYSRKLKVNEYKMFDLADKYIFITKQLERIINVNNKPYCIAHGTYKVEKQIVDKYNDSKIHIVYSGIIDKLKKGAFMACDLSKYLDEKYVIHIIGFGTENDVNELKNTIDNYNNNNRCKIVYDGLKKGDDYIRYIQKCHIGLSTQDPKEKYNETSFPSKILAYLSNGLRVVSIDIPAIKTSNVSNIIYYYKNNDPKEIAYVIKKINIDDDYDSRKLIKELDKKFAHDLMEVLDE